MFEKKHQQVISRKEYVGRQIRYTMYTIGIMLFSIGLGITGYMYTDNLSFVDALLNASMILTGMGPVDVMKSDAAKYFASFYALYSGVAFLTMMSVFLAPAVHRLLHKMNIEE